MKVVLQRITQSELKINNEIYSKTGPGLLLLVGITHNDNLEEVKYITEKCLNLRIFEDNDGKMNLSVKDIEGEIMVVSQFTLYGNTNKGRRPSFENAATPVEAEPVYNLFIETLNKSGLIVKTGKFGEDMKIDFINDGPVTFVIEK